ncbi:nitrite reductase small subunit NirD [Veronia pacifica]|uniref:Nitrite reductase small subunit n=1 Tax=Veronia pacifica TaxID=1080227 RepID=A0A1C3EKX3_9GAMM|nr:nitrite reductase small subunit NirD [Veronia pacifica]ODA33882.1 nitrite reductase small subunit [Veronia pacifica]
MSIWQTVCEKDVLIADTGVCALVGDEQVAIFLSGFDDALYAINNFDPIGKANVLSRGIIGSIDDKVVVASPLYKQHFCLTSGQCIEQEDIFVSTYEIRIDGNQIQVALGA